MLRGTCNPDLVSGLLNSASPIMVSLAVLGALSRATGRGYVTFLSSHAYFSESESVDVVRSLLSLTCFFQMWSGSEAFSLVLKWNACFLMHCWNLNKLFKEKFVYLSSVAKLSFCNKLRRGCLGLHLVGSWKLQRMEAAQPLHFRGERTLSVVQFATIKGRNCTHLQPGYSLFLTNVVSSSLLRL